MREILMAYRIFLQALIGGVGILLIVLVYVKTGKREKKAARRAQERAVLQTGDETLVQLLAQAKTQAERDEILRFAEKSMEQAQAEEMEQERQAALSPEMPAPEESYTLQSISFPKAQPVLEQLVKEEAALYEASLAEQALKSENALNILEEVEDDDELDQDGVLTAFSEPPAEPGEVAEVEEEGALAAMLFDQADPAETAEENPDSISETKTIDLGRVAQAADADPLAGDTTVLPED